MYPPDVQNPVVHLLDWGSIPYAEAWERQKAYLNRTVELKIRNRKTSADDQTPTPNYLVFCEHPPVYTLGKSGDPGNILLPEAERAEKGIDFYHIERGGDVTFHGPGQLVGYPIFDLENFRTDLNWYLRQLEEAVVLLLADYGLVGGRIQGLTGVWVGIDGPNPRKICAMGLKCSRWVSMHGFALNVNTDLRYFSYIIPCGIQDKGVTSLAAELGQPVSLTEVQQQLLVHLATTLGFTLAG
jgi:lipoyl(octanoyl) transferase